MRKRLETIRKFSQAAFLLLFVYLLFAPPGGLPSHLFVRTDPLAGGSALLAARQWAASLVWPLLPLVVLSILAGRLFCGWICPLGTLVDTADGLARRRRQVENTARRRTKYYVLGAVVLAAAAGAQLAFLADPLVLLTRSLTLGVAAPLQAVLRAAGVSSWGPASLTDLLPESQAYYRESLLSLGILVGVLGLAAVGRRFWCRTLCPLGALYGLLGCRSGLRLRVSEKCVECGRCARECPTGAIFPAEPRRYLGAECTACMHCLRVCPTAAISLGWTGGGRQPGTDLSRRRLLAAGGVGLAWAAGVKWEGANKPTVSGVRAGSPRLLRPPGALAEEEFLRRCVRCQQCVKACPTNGLQPALTEAGWEGLWTPVLAPTLGPCAEACTYCGQVCPTGAIAPFTLAEKQHLFIGTARIDRSRCLAWGEDRECLVCDEVCAYRAIEMREEPGAKAKRPFIIDEICVGCGLCENKCPIQPDAAIKVYNMGDKRHWSRRRQAEWRQTGRRSDAGPDSTGYPYPEGR